jgi:LPS export ABC transporter permease LptG
MWLPNTVMLLLGIVLLARMERPGRRDYFDVLGGLFQRPAARLAGSGRGLARFEWRRLPLFPQIIDAHITSRFLFYFVLWLASFILLLDVFTFFELLGDIIRNNISPSKVGAYLFFLTPRWIYELTPVSVLTSVLVVLGILSKDNEVTAYKACGISVYRLAVPVLLTSLLLSGALFAFNYYVVPGADRQQNLLRIEIKNLPPQTLLNAGRKWIWGLDNRVFNYSYYDSTQKVMGKVNVFEIDPKTFQLKRHIFAESARWDTKRSAWVFENGWSRDMNGTKFGPLDNFTGGFQQFAEVKEDPDYFQKEKIQIEQMNTTQLETYIAELERDGSDTTVWRVQYFKKFAVPLFAFILALVSVPFGLGTGTRGALAGVGISFGIYVVYVSVQQLFEVLGNLNQLPPDIAAWSPDAMFSLAGLYLLARVRS